MRIKNINLCSRNALSKRTKQTEKWCGCPFIAQWLFHFPERKFTMI